MSINPAVRKLNQDLSKLKKATNAEKKAEAKATKDKAAEQAALQKITAQEQALIDSFAQQPTTDPKALADLLGKAVQLGVQYAQTKDQFDNKLAADKSAIVKDKKAMGADKKQALKDLKPAEYHLSLKDTNKDRAELGLKALKKPLRQQFNAGSWHRGPGSLQGADTSSWESGSQFAQSIAGRKWTAIKASEGTNWTDPTFKSRWAQLGKLVHEGKMKLRVAYQFMHPGNGVAQAKHFLNTVGVHGKLQAGTRLCLDWEASALNDPGALRDAANYIHKVTGVWPMVYVQGSEMSRAKAAVPHAPIWEAAWGGSVNRNVPFFQYSDGPGWDHDVFNGDLKSLERFAGYNV